MNKTLLPETPGDFAVQVNLGQGNESSNLKPIDEIRIVSSKYIIIDW